MCLCSGEESIKNATWARWPYEQPKPYVDGIGKWVPPEWTVPNFCSQLDAINKKFVAMENHPCNWMAWPDVSLESAR